MTKAPNDSFESLNEDVSIRALELLLYYDKEKGLNHCSKDLIRKAVQATGLLEGLPVFSDSEADICTLFISSEQTGEGCLMLLLADKDHYCLFELNNENDDHIKSLVEKQGGAIRGKEALLLVRVDVDRNKIQEKLITGT